MYKKKKILALIPARGGSKGVPRKNIRLLSGKPLIGWTIDQARESRYIDEIIVSTEDPAIAEVSKKSGAIVPFIRPRALAEDASPMIDVIIHALKWLRDNGGIFDLVVLLQPTSPLRTPEDIDRAIELFFSKKAKTVVAVCLAGHHPYRMNILPRNGRMNKFIKPCNVHIGRQKLPVFYYINGAVYVADINYIMRYKTLYGNNTYAYIMPEERSVDIDNEIDFYFSEYLLRRHYDKIYKDYRKT